MLFANNRGHAVVSARFAQISPVTVAIEHAAKRPRSKARDLYSGVAILPCVLVLDWCEPSRHMLPYRKKNRPI